MGIVRRCYEASKGLRKLSPQKYWNKYPITGKRKFKTQFESLSYHNYYMGQYLFYKNAMGWDNPDTFKDLTILDHGCGTGNTIVPLLEYTHPKKVIGCDISIPALNIAHGRVLLHPHGDEVKLVHLESDYKLPFNDEAFDYIFSIGVIHHIPRYNDCLKELYRVLKPNGKIRLLVYNYDSVYVHLNIAYLRQIVGGLDKKSTICESFQRSSEHGYCPYSHLFTPNGLEESSNIAGFKCNLNSVSNAISLVEMNSLIHISDAIECKDLSFEHRAFLRFLNFCNLGIPIHIYSYGKDIAGIDLMAELIKE